MINEKFFKDLGWQIRESQAFNSIDFKSPRTERFMTFYLHPDKEDKDLVETEKTVFMSQVFDRVTSQLEEVRRDIMKNLTHLIKKEQEVPHKLTVTIDIYP